ncbi:MAG TPA: UDP-3-O-acyl-N-acetylglucosamine deacetylase [Paracoccaceae bacterium]|nr:UDP-3-O-acyl-N-acetylglucosamine deacetylase [Paracoccaceae bacterium]
MQATINTSINIVGTGLHSGRMARMAILPAEANHGIVFHRVDITDRDNVIPARYDLVTDTVLCTKLTNAAGADISTVEHLMAAFAGCGIHNALVEINGPEIPIMDGSSVKFVREILKAGKRKQAVPLRVIRILREVAVSVGDAQATIRPSQAAEIAFEIDFDAAAIGQQALAKDMRNGSFIREFADCRTFCRSSDVEKMQSLGLARGGSLENAVVVDGDKILNPEGFRRGDECVRHKMLDALGDMALAGMPILGAYSGLRAGHAVTNQLLRALFAAEGAFEVVEADAAIMAALPGEDLHRADFLAVS